MKTLDERMDLIAQRAQILKLKQQRRRKTAALIVTPLSLCLLLCCLWLPANRSADSAPTENLAGSALGSSFNQVQIHSDGKTSTVTDADFVSKLYGCIAQVEELQTENAPLIIPDVGNKHSYAHIEICFANADGAQLQYTLLGKALTNHTTGVVHHLSSAQFLQLRTALREIVYEK